METFRPNRIRIAVTGIGAVTPHAESADATWAALLRGDRAVRSLGVEELGYAEFAGEPGWGPWHGAPAAGIDRRSARQGLEDPVLHLARQAAREAVRGAGLTSTNVDSVRVGCVFGTSKGGLESVRLQPPIACRENRRSPVADGDVLFWTSVPADVPCAALCAEYGWQGPSLAPVAACATGLVSLIRGAALIRDGNCDVVVAGSSDASLQPALLASFKRLGVLAPAGPDPGRACRPCDLGRSGFAVGEGAGVVVLERWEHAVARGAPLLAEWMDGLQRGDPQGLTVLSADPVALCRLLEDLLKSVDLQTAAIDAVSLHGTATRTNDAYESQALRRLCGSSADQLTAFGLKGGIGHLLGAAGSVEAVAAICALRDQLIPPTVNCDVPAPDCPIPVSLHQPVRRPVHHLLKMSLGFGGHLAAGLFRRV